MESGRRIETRRGDDFGKLNPADFDTSF